MLPNTEVSAALISYMKRLEDATPELLRGRGSIVQVSPRLYLTDLIGVARLRTKLISDYSIFYILNAARRYPTDVLQLFDPQIQIMSLDIDDKVSSNILHLLPQVVRFIEEGLNSGKSVLVHCIAGISRSVSCILAYWIWKERISLQAAIQRVRIVRPQAQPNWGFGVQLLVWQKRCFRLPTGEVPICSTDADSASDDEDVTTDDHHCFGNECPVVWRRRTVLPPPLTGAADDDDVVLVDEKVTALCVEQQQQRQCGHHQHGQQVDGDQEKSMHRTGLSHGLSHPSLASIPLDELSTAQQPDDSGHWMMTSRSPSPKPAA
eukprot:ANDGO_06099.mRNA.1 Dual specificity protein phosphatase Mpk3